MTPGDLRALPTSASWWHTGLRDGFEVLFAEGRVDGHRLRAHTAANEAGVVWSVGLLVEVDRSWTTRTAEAVIDDADGTRHLRLTRDTSGNWTVDGVPRPELDGCSDVDFESSAVTNTLPVHRLALTPGRPVEVPAAFVRVDGSVQRLEQTYALTSVTEEAIDVAYTSATFDFECVLRYDRSGLITDYPGIARRCS